MSVKHLPASARASPAPGRRGASWLEHVWVAGGLAAGGGSPEKETGDKGVEVEGSQAPLAPTESKAHSEPLGGLP